MGGVSVGGGGGGRRSLDSEINMIPFIDLLMVTISFLLITAVWSHMARINADAQVPGPPREVEPDKIEPEKQLHVEMRTPDKFVLIWKQSGTVISTVDVPRKDNLIVKDGKKSITPSSRRRSKPSGRASARIATVRTRSSTRRSSTPTTRRRTSS